MVLAAAIRRDGHGNNHPLLSGQLTAMSDTIFARDPHTNRIHNRVHLSTGGGSVRG